METGSHKVFHYLEHLWPLVSGIVITMLAVVRLWWRDRKETKKQVADLRTFALYAKDHMVTKEELQECRDEVRDVDDHNLDMIFKEIRENTRENATQHQDIMKQILRLHGGD